MYAPAIIFGVEWLLKLPLLMFLLRQAVLASLSLPGLMAPPGVEAELTMGIEPKTSRLRNECSAN